MSAPTPKWSDDHTLAIIAGDLATEWPATPADVRLWLLDQGATEQQWCETHRGFWSLPIENPENIVWESCVARRMWEAHADLDYPEDMPMYEDCRVGMVSVLVYRSSE